MISKRLQVLCVVSAFCSLRPLPVKAQRTDSVSPQFEVASVKPSAPGPIGRTAGSPSPGTFSVAGLQLRPLVALAYGVEPYQVLGGPKWVDEQPYDITAKAEENSSQDQLSLKLKALLEDRFQLKIHRETKLVSVYALTVAKGGLKLHQVEEASCVPSNRFLAPPEPRQKPLCGTGGFRRGVLIAGQISVISIVGQISAISLDGFCKALGSRLGRPVIDKTGKSGLFDIRVEFAPDETTPGFTPGGLTARTNGGLIARTNDAEGPSIFTAFQEQLGLKLDPDKGAVDFLIIQSAEKPSEN